MSNKLLRYGFRVLFLGHIQKMKITMEYNVIVITLNPLVIFHWYFLIDLLGYIYWDMLGLKF
ncbi:unnamed protein product [Brugia timori]|uniref:Uncharacterized protein n=1 Tax=Brugia timori TaxID=42155 RepID=A0A3P7T5Y5_9BILA|nr:unnamed protein product [Brugia timori]